MNNRHILGFMRFVTLGLALCTMTSTVSASTNTFTPAQEKAMGKVIHQYIVGNPEVLVEASRALQAKQQKTVAQKATNAIVQHADAIFNTKSPFAGNPNASVAVVEFFDYQCGHCKTMEGVIKQVLAENKNIRVIYKELPIFGENSRNASLAAIAANMQGKYLAFHHALMTERGTMNKKHVFTIAKKLGLDVDKLKKDMKSSAAKAELANNMQLADALGLGGTPAFIVANSKNPTVKTSFFIGGTTTAKALMNYIKQAH